MKYQPFVLSNPVRLDWHSKSDLLNPSVLTAKSQSLVVEQGLDDVVPGLELSMVRLPGPERNLARGLLRPKGQDLVQERIRSDIS
jgi:hypothetical protein